MSTYENKSMREQALSDARTLRSLTFASRVRLSLQHKYRTLVFCLKTNFRVFVLNFEVSLFSFLVFYRQIHS